MIFLAALLMLPAAQDSAAGAEPPSCQDEVRQGDVLYVRHRGYRGCTDFEEPRRFEGLWINSYESSTFIEGARDVGDVPADWDKLKICFGTDASTVWPRNLGERNYGSVYRVRFTGRAAKDMNRPPLGGYCHMGVSPALVLADWVIAIEYVGQVNDLKRRSAD